MRPKENPWGWPQACEPTVCLKYQMGRGTRSTSTLQHIARVLTGSDLLEDREFSHARGGFLPRHDEDLREPLVRRQGSQVSMRVARGSASWLSTLEAGKRWARLAQARAASRPGLCATAPPAIWVPFPGKGAASRLRGACESFRQESKASHKIGRRRSRAPGWVCRERTTEQAGGKPLSQGWGPRWVQEKPWCPGPLGMLGQPPTVCLLR